MLLVTHIDQLKPKLPESALADGEVAWQDAINFQADFDFANKIARRWCKGLAYRKDDQKMLLEALSQQEKEVSQLIKRCEAQFSPAELEGLSVTFMPFKKEAQFLWHEEEKAAALRVMSRAKN